MKKVLIFTAVAAWIVACGNSAENTGATADNSTAPKAEAVDGEKIYKQYCVTCHGLYGDMGASGAANLQVSQLSVEERVKVVTNGREGTAMTSFSSLLSPEKIAAVAEYTTTLKPTN